jgi:hypothetical protein
VPHRHTGKSDSGCALSAEHYSPGAVTSTDLENAAMAAGFVEYATMRGFAGYLLIGSFAAAAMGLATVAGIAVAAHPVAGPGLVIQYVDRAYKGDRLDMHTRVGTGPIRPASRPAKMPIGCEPLFSPLAASVRSNYSGRCLAVFPLAHTMAG